jgi:hypothetical protein
MNFERNRKIFTEDTVAVYREINKAVNAVLENRNVCKMLGCPIYSSDHIADVVVTCIDFTRNQVSCDVYVTRDYDEYAHEYVSIPLEWLTQEGSLDKALAQRKAAEQDEKDRLRAELQKFQEQFKDV